MYIIKDWIGNTLFNSRKFNSFEDAWGFIYKNVKDENSAYDDYFVVLE